MNDDNSPYTSAQHGVSPPCVRCDQPVKNIPSEKNHPLGALVFQSHGQYGSTEFDPCDGSRLELNLCDPCVAKVAQSHLIFFEANDK